MVEKRRLLKDILWFLALSGGVAMVFRLWFGLGATTNMSDEVPWGLWKILNMVAGAALATSGFTVGFLYYVLKMEKFKPLVKPAVLVAFLGYGSSLYALLFDIGLPQRFYFPFFNWNENSFLFEVFWCVSTYFMVTFVELTPTILERTPFKKMGAFLHKISFGIVVFGITLSCLHHSSLGSLFLVTPQRLHPLWYSPLLPLFFIISAMGAGIMLLIFVKIVYARLYNPEPVFGPEPAEDSTIVCTSDGSKKSSDGPIPSGKEIPMLQSLATIAASLLALYFGLKIFDLSWHNKWGILLEGTWESWLFVFELVIAALIPIILVAVRRTRNSPKGLAAAAFFAVAGLALNRLDVGIFGYFRNAQQVYFPSLLEWTLSIGVLAAAALVFLFIVENFAVFDNDWAKRKRAAELFSASFDSMSRVWNTVLRNGLHRVTLIAIFTIPLAFIFLYPPYSRAYREEITVQPAIGLDSLRDTLRVDGDRCGLLVDFPHVDHQHRLGEKASCVKCHHISLPGDHSTPCNRCHQRMESATRIFDHEKHCEAVARKEHLSGLNPANHSCVFCHTPGQPQDAYHVKSCLDCHKDDMGWTEKRNNSDNLEYAGCYRAAMHDNCIPCHRREEQTSNHPGLGECYTCHQSLKPRPGTLETALNPVQNQKDPPSAVTVEPPALPSKAKQTDK